MAENSKIEWTDHTFNPWWGCQRVSPGCQHCYAETLANRYGQKVWGPAKTTERRMMSENYWRQPLKWNKEAEKTGQRKRVFCASMADVFEDHPQLVEPRKRLFDLIFRTQNLDWLLLTKRPENIIPMLRAIPVLKRDNVYDHLWSKYFQNVWIGTSVENQEQADKRIPELLKVPAAVRFLSCEPLLGPVDLSGWLGVCPACLGSGETAGYYFSDDGIGPCDDCGGKGIGESIHWVICGGESGHGARPMHPEWARSLRDQCQAAGVAFHFKQWGEYTPYYEQAVPETGEIRLAEYGKGMKRVGKGRAGRVLDGLEWNELPKGGA